MKVHLVMYETSGYGIYQYGREHKIHSCYTTRKRANTVARLKNERSTTCRYWVVSKEVAE